MALLEIKHLGLKIGETPILQSIDLSIKPGEVLGLVGESGSGKSLSALSIMQLLPEGAKTTGSILFDKRQLLGLDENKMCDLRGNDIAMVFQEPMSALNPVMTIGEQIAEGIQFHTQHQRKAALIEASEMLERVGLSPSRNYLERYPHELSGGQRQRVVIAIACAMRPRLLIADEPTTALDVMVQAQILELLGGLVKEFDMALLLISHDLGVVAQNSDRIAIIRQGKLVESGPTLKVLSERKHEYTKMLAAASTHVPQRTHPSLTPRETKENGISPLLRVQNLSCEYTQKRKNLFHKPKPFRAVDQISFDIYPGQTIGLVGESGCGKSTLARTLLGLHPLAEGTISHSADNTETQIIFQDPFGSFNPRQKVKRLIKEALFSRTSLSETEKHELVITALEDVGLSAQDTEKYIHEFSGGQRQRLAIARAIVSSPQLIIADEPVSALDVSIRAKILDLLVALREKRNIAFLFISHDLSVVRGFCDEVLVMKDGIILEQGDVKSIFANPVSPYTQELIKAAPDLNQLLKET